jgi:hypothetical protein
MQREEIDTNRHHQQGENVQQNEIQDIEQLDIVVLPVHDANCF